MDKKEVEEYIIEQKIEDGIRKGLTKWAHTICMTATSAIMGAAYALGGFLYNHWHQFEAAVKAWLIAGRGGQ